MGKVTDSVTGRVTEPYNFDFVETWKPTIRYLLRKGVVPKRYEELDLQVY